MPLPSTATWRSGLTRYVMACLPFKDGRPQGWGNWCPMSRPASYGPSNAGRRTCFCESGNSDRSNQVFSPRQEFLVLAATIKGNGESIMATKITTALVAALVVGALMTPNHEALARGGGGLAAEVMEVVSTAEASTEVVSTVVDSGSTGDSEAPTDLDATSDMDAASDFMVAIRTFMAGGGGGAAPVYYRALH